MKRKGVLLTLLLVFSLIGTSLGVVYLRFMSLPHPNEASHNQLMYWIVLRDLEDHDRSVQLALVDRFSTEASKIFSKNSEDITLNENQSERLLSNIGILKQVWFEDRIAKYSKITQLKNREVFLGKQIRLLDEFGVIAFEYAEILYPEKAKEDLTTISDEILKDIDKWVEATPPDSKEITSQAVREATVFWLSTQDLSLLVMDARKELTLRVIDALEKGMDLAMTASVVSQEKSNRLQQNSMHLMEAWIQILAEEYAAISDSAQKREYVDAKIKSVISWRLLEFIGGPEDGPSSSWASMARFNNTMMGWVDAADGELKPKLERFYRAIQQRILVGMITGGKPG